MRLLYPCRRDALIRALQKHHPEWTIRGIAAGLHLVAMLPRGTDERLAVRTAADHDVRLYPIGPYWQHRPKRDPHGLVLGYAHLTEPEIADGINAGLADKPYYGAVHLT